MRLPNYQADSNPFQLAGPPDWFLRQLWDFDDSLVICPSRMGIFYRLGQRRPLKLKESIVNDVMKEQADTAMLARYSLVPVTTIMATVRWDNPAIFEELRRRAPWRWGGAEKFEALIDAQEKREELGKAAEQDDMLNQLSKDSWRFYNKLIGTRSHMWSPTVKGSSQPQPHVHGLSIPKPSYKPTVQTAWGDVTRRGGR